MPAVGNAYAGLLAAHGICNARAITHNKEIIQIRQGLQSRGSKASCLQAMAATLRICATLWVAT
eukprot:5273719-Pleurochrysis_carterae.AAC.1